jgi:TPR repeat protein
VILNNCQFENLEEAIIKDISAKIESIDTCSFPKCNKHVTETVDDETKKSVINDANEFIRRYQLPLLDNAMVFLRKTSKNFHDHFNRWKTCSREPIYMPEAAFLLGMCCIEGVGVHEDTEKAFEYFKKASDSNYAPAQHILAASTEDTNEKMKLLEKSASQGYAPAQNVLGIALKNTNKNLAREWLEKASAQEYALAQYNLAFLLEVGSEEAVHLFIKAANQGHVDAAYQIWENYLNHKTDLKHEEALAYLTKAAGAEHSTGEAEYSLGLYYYDLNKLDNAKVWFEIAKRNGHKEAGDALQYLLEMKEV